MLFDGSLQQFPHSAFGFASKRSMPAKNSKRIRVKREAAVTTSTAIKSPRIVVGHLSAKSGLIIQTPAVDTVSMAYNAGNQMAANRRAPRAPNVLTIRVFDMSGVFIIPPYSPFDHLANRFHFFSGPVSDNGGE